MQITIDLATVVSFVSASVTLAFTGYLALFKFSVDQWQGNIKKDIAAVEKDVRNAEAATIELKAKTNHIEGTVRNIELASTKQGSDVGHLSQSFDAMRDQMNDINDKLDRLLSRSATIPDMKGKP